jgi:hypothetical protein
MLSTERDLYIHVATTLFLGSRQNVGTHTSGRLWETNICLWLSTGYGYTSFTTMPKLTSFIDFTIRRLCTCTESTVPVASLQMRTEGGLLESIIFMHSATGSQPGRLISRNESVSANVGNSCDRSRLISMHCLMTAQTWDVLSQCMWPELRDSSLSPNTKQKFYHLSDHWTRWRVKNEKFVVTVQQWRRYVLGNKKTIYELLSG